MSKRWTFSTLGCPELGLGEAVELAKGHGLADLELRTVEDRVDLPELFRERFGNAEALGEWLKERGVRVVALDASLKLVGNREEDRSAFLEFVEWAEALRVPYLRVFDGGTYGETISGGDLEAALETVNWWRRERESGGWETEIMVETHDCLTASASVIELQGKLERPLAVLWDTHHTWKKAGENPRDTWEALGRWVVHVHVKDSISKPSARHPFTYVQLGEGEFPLEETLKLLEEGGYTGPRSIEWERKWHPYLPPLETALKRARELGWW